MISSRLSPTINYEEDLTIPSEDNQHESYIYQTNEFEKDFFFAIGKPNYMFSSKGITIYYIYLVSTISNNIVARIGLFEIRINDNLKILNNKDEIDVNKLGEPLFYEVLGKILFDLEVSQKEYIIKNTKKEEPKKEESKKEEPKKEEPKKLEIEIEDEIEDDIKNRFDDMLDLKIPSESISKVKVEIEKILDNDLFTINEIPRRQLPIEDKEMANKIVKGYKNLSSHNWIKETLKNPNYQIHQTNNNGDCFFQVIKDAFDQIGHYTTISKLRAIVAKNTSEDTFKQNRDLYVRLLHEIELITEEMYLLKHHVEVVNKKKGGAKGITQDELRDIVKDTTVKKTEFQKYNERIDFIKQIIDETFGPYYGPITTIEKFREFMLSSRYWADPFAINILEKELNIKFIILSELFKTDSTNILICGETLVSIQETGYFKPDYYIMTSYSGNHYELVSYRDHKILTFSEIPYHLKTVAIKKCMARIGHTFSFIEDFRNFQLELGINNNDSINSKESENISDLHDSSVLMFYSNSANAKPGGGAGDNVTEDKYSSFIDLKNITNWRRKLDDSWLDIENPFTINGNGYSSVMHYYQGSKFKHGFPDFAKEFSIDSKSEMSMDIDLCKKAVLPSKLKAKNIKVDEDFFHKRHLKEIDLAIHAKFSQNGEMKKVLLNTNKAKLIHYVGSKAPEVANNLMKLRLELSQRKE